MATGHSQDILHVALQRVALTRVDAATGARSEEDELAVEEPLEIRVRGRSISVTMRTPGHDEELAAGFLFTEGQIRQTRDVVGLAHCQEGEAASFRNIINVFVAPDCVLNLEALTRHVFASSSCGVCGKATIESVHQRFPPMTMAEQIPIDVVRRLVQGLAGAQPLFARTGGAHAAAVFDFSGQCVVVREDVGRHNAVDKVIGYGFLRGLLPWAQQVLLVSGRASFEIVQKALAARIPVVVAVSAPSSLAVEFARENGQTLIGFLRETRMNVYAGGERLCLSM